MKSDIAQSIQLEKTSKTAESISINNKQLTPYEHHIAKVIPKTEWSTTDQDNKLILVTAIEAVSKVFLRQPLAKLNIITRKNLPLILH